MTPPLPPPQAAALLELRAAMLDADDCGALVALAGYCHPDQIRAVRDGLDDLIVLEDLGEK